MSDGGDAMQTIRSVALGAIVAVTAALGQGAAAQDKVKVGVFPTASSLPYFVAIERGLFKEKNIEPETIRLIGGPPNIAAMISNQIDAAIVLVTIEAMNANIKKPGVAMYIGVHSQSKIYQMEQFVARTGYRAAALKDLKGARIMSAPGPANLVAAKAVLAKVGLNDAQARRSAHARGRGHRQVHPRGRRRQCVCGRLRDHQRLHQEPPRRRPPLRRGVEEGHRFRQQQPPGGAQVPRQEYAHPRRRGRYGADGALLHGGRAHGQTQGGVSEIHRLRDICQHAAGARRHHQVSTGVLTSRADGPTGRADQCPQLGVERTQRGRRLWAVHDPNPTCEAQKSCAALVSSPSSTSYATVTDVISSGCVFGLFLDDFSNR